MDLAAYNIKNILQKHYMVLFLIIITLIIFFQVSGHEFVTWDDGKHVYNNPYMNPPTPSNILHFWRKPHDFALTYTLWAIQALFAKTPTTETAQTPLDPHFFHITNLFFHILSVLVIFFILRILFKHDWAAFGGALLFAIHPVQVEPVAWVTGLKDVLSGFLSLAAVWQYLLFARFDSTSRTFSDKHSKNSVDEKRNNTEKELLKDKKKWLYYILSVISFILAITAKPTAVVVPVIILILDYWILKRPIKKSITLLAGWIVISLPIIILAGTAQPASRLGYVPPLWSRPLILGDTIMFYLYKLVFPASLGIDYGRSPEFVLQQGLVFSLGIIPFLFLILVWYYRKRSPWLTASVGVFVISILPISGVLSFYFQYFSTVADRYLYFAMLGPAMAMTWFLSRNWKNVVITIYVLILILLGVRCSDQIKHWKNSYLLFKHALEVNPDSWSAHSNIGVIFTDQGIYKQAVSHYLHALRIKPDFAEAHNNMGVVLKKQGKFQEAVKYFSEAIRIKPKYAAAHHDLGMIFGQQGKIKEAITHYSNAILANPDFAEVHNNIGIILERAGRHDEAVKHYSESLRIKPDFYQAYYNLGACQEKTGNIDDAIKYYTMVLKINPYYELAKNSLKAALKKKGKNEIYILNYFQRIKTKGGREEVFLQQGVFFERQGKLAEAIENYSRAIQIKPDYVHAYFNRGNVFYRVGKLDKAVENYLQALKIKPDFVAVHNNLGYVLERQGKIEEAITHYSEALRINPEYTDAKNNLLRLQKKYGIETGKQPGGGDSF